MNDLNNQLWRDAILITLQFTHWIIPSDEMSAHDEVQHECISIPKDQKQTKYHYFNLWVDHTIV